MRIRLSVLLVSLLVVALLPSAAFARGAKAPAPQGMRPLFAYGPDMYEPDDTTVTAKSLPAVSLHTNHFVEGVGDKDWFVISADATGQPFVLDTEFLAGVWDPYMGVYRANPDGTMVAVMSENDDDPMFDTYASARFFKAPSPGTYYVQVRQRARNFGKYEIQIGEGLGRRLAGTNRFETAVKISKRMFGDTENPSWGEYAGPTSIMLVNANDAPDAMTVGALGWMIADGPAPVLLTLRDGMPQVTKAEIERLAKTQPTTVYAVGGTDQINNAQLSAIDALPNVVGVKRIAGPNRYATASLIASAAVDLAENGVDSVVIVNGSSWVDGLAAGPVAGVGSSPILLTTKYALPDVTASWIESNTDITDAIIVGSPSAVDTAVADQLEDMGLIVERVGGDNRYETARLLAQYGVDNLDLNGDRLVLATGASFADGLAATPMTQMMNCPILLTPPGYLSTEVETFYKDNGPMAERSYIIGGLPTIPASVADVFNTLWVPRD